MREEKTEKCTRQYALIAVRNVKFHSNPTLAGQFTVEIVGQREDHQEGADTKFGNIMSNEACTYTLPMVIFRGCRIESVLRINHAYIIENE
jgi:hypothetical protein